MKTWMRANKGFLMFLLLFGVFRTAVADWNPIPSASMRPNLLEGDVVFVNRLAQGIPLATDPTVVYSALLDDRWRGTIYASDLQNPSPYNTYRHPGLPPGPICSPGLASLRAALHPTPTDYLYFVSDANGHSRFATTLKEHNENVTAYRKAHAAR